MDQKPLEDCKDEEELDDSMFDDPEDFIDDVTDEGWLIILFVVHFMFNIPAAVSGV